MNRLTPFSKFLMTLAIVAALFFGAKWILDNTEFGRGFKEGQAEAAKTSDPTLPAASGNYGNSDNSATASGSGAASSTDNVASSDGGTASFNYSAPEPVNGTMKGVVELGATGFNSFIVNIDRDKNWKLLKSQFNYSLVTENMATDEDIRSGLKNYISGMLDYGVSGRNIHFVVSSGALKADVTQRIIKALKSLGYQVNTVTPQQEGALALKSVLPKDYEGEAYVVDIGSGNTKISWVKNGSVSALETFGSKYYQNGNDDGVVYNEVKKMAAGIPTNNRGTCFIIGGVPFQMAKEVRQGKERYTVLREPNFYKFDDAKNRAGINIYKGVKDGTGTEQFIFDWDANFTIGFLLNLPK